MLFVRTLCFIALGISPLLAEHTQTEISSGFGQVNGLIDWLLMNEDHLEDIPFASVVMATSGHRVLPVDSNDINDQRMLAALELALDVCLETAQKPDHPIHQVGRVNEISRYFEDILLEQLNAMDDYECGIPTTASGEHQRSGYPDLRLLQQSTGRVFYIDPKIYKLSSEDSSFRTFYFEPKGATNKILDDASHLIVGIAHSDKVDAIWQFNHWQIVDLAEFKVRLKAEFQASNRDLYQEQAILSRSE